MAQDTKSFLESSDTKVILNSDIYNVADMVNKLAKDYIPEMTEDTMSVGLPGFIIALESTKFKTNAIMTSALANEVFPQRALLDRNVITHAIMEGVKNINAIPSHMTVVLGLSEEDFLRYSIDKKNQYRQFTFDKYCTILLEHEYAFHLDYNIILRRTKSNKITDNEYEKFVYTAMYDMPNDYRQYNRISAIDNPYIKQPYITKVGDENYIFIQTTLHQVNVERSFSTFITSNVIDNRTIVFSFEQDQQLADFEVRVTEPNKTESIYLTPVFEGSAMDNDIGKYCEYTYINTNTIRINFVRASYIPGLNAQVEIVTKTTRGSDGIFKYDKAVFVNFASPEYGYPNGVNILLRPNTESTGGVDRKTVEELHKILPKQILMNGAITTETDLNNYFNLINTDTEKIIMMRKSDSQIERLYYAYMLAKNSFGNVVPTNTITIDIPETEFPVITEDGNLILPAGSIVVYDPETRTGVITHNPEEIKRYTYVYMMLYTIEVIMDPLYAGFFMTTINKNPYASYAWINTEATVQFMLDTFNFERSMFEDVKNYHLTFTITQNICAPEDMYIVEEQDDGTVIITNNMKCFLVLYQNGIPYRYTEATLTYADLTYYRYDWEVVINTSNNFDYNNYLMLNDMYVAGTDTQLYGYFPQNVEAYVYVLANSECIGTDNRYDLDNTIVTAGESAFIGRANKFNKDGKTYGVTNKFEVHGGLDFFVDYSGILNSTITARENPEVENSNIYNLQGVPVIGYEYVTDPDVGAENFLEFLGIMDEKKAYMDEALVLLENSFGLDYKFYNTYGPSRLYTSEVVNLSGIVEDDAELESLIVYQAGSAPIFPNKGDIYLVRNSAYGINVEFIFDGWEFQVCSTRDLKSIGRVDINIVFTLYLKSASDIYTKDNIVKYVKDYIENLSITNEDVDISNMMSDIKVAFASQINYIDYEGFNQFDSNVQHMYWTDPSDITVPPEFINIRTYKNENGEFVPNIIIDVVD